MHEIERLGGYSQFLQELKDRISSAQVRAAFADSKELASLYRQIGKDLTERMEKSGGEDRVVRQLACDLQLSSPGIEEFSFRNMAKRLS